VATSAAHTLAIDKGAGIVRVHQVQMAVDAAAVADAIRLTDC
jgi:dihydropteroate synthase